MPADGGTHRSEDGAARGAWTAGAESAVRDAEGAVRDAVTGARASASAGGGAETATAADGSVARGADGGRAPESGTHTEAAVLTESESESAFESESEFECESATQIETKAEEQVETTVRDAVSAPDAEGRPRRTTRRFPLFTRDTARPEGSGRAASGDAPAPARQWPILTVLSAVALGLLLTALDVFRFGTILIGVALLAGAVMRWMLPSVGMLAVRSRFTDMLTYGALGLAIVLLALMIQPDPLLKTPFLKDMLHFTLTK